MLAALINPTTNAFCLDPKIDVIKSFSVSSSLARAIVCAERAFLGARIDAIIPSMASEISF